MRRYKKTGWQIYDVCPPEEDGVYLVTDHHGVVFPAVYRAKGYGKTGRLVTDKFPVWRDMETEEQLYEEEVIAWMELPEPFEG